MPWPRRRDGAQSPPQGVFRGICQNYSYGSYTAGGRPKYRCRPQGELKIHRIVAAIDPGYAVNPNQIAAQTQGSFVYGLSAVLFGEITIDKGRAVQTNFDTYPVMRIADMPKVETIVAPSGGFWGGVGEPTIAVAGPAVLNAIFAATGKRIRTLPLRHARSRARMRRGGVAVLAVMLGAAAPPPGASSCSGCHGGVAPLPVLAGRECRPTIVAELDAFRAGTSRRQ